MTTIKPVLNGRACKDGRYTLIVQIIHHRERGVIFTPYRLSKEEFDPVKGVAVAREKIRRNKVRISRINKELNSYVRELKCIVAEKEKTGLRFSSKDITSACRKRNDNRNIDTPISGICAWN